ncbi:MAG TPA: glutamyl-tRNA reductase [Candidatus Polarisedimenticolia bacterium]|nr:glutamyl-tRNA reductase [Candidatus Polarisedimenticolia bacterium]
MPIYLYGMNHQSAPLAVRERVAFPGGDLGDAVGRLVRVASVHEGLILSTCNRTEILVHAAAEGVGEALKRFVVGERRVSEDELDRHCYLRADGEAVRHLFRVASSLDSMVVGEAQILGQVKDAYTVAVGARGVGAILEPLMQRSFAVAKRVRTETGIARHPVSIAHAAAGLARDIFGDLRDRSILILGAGEMARVAATHLIGDGVASVVVVNRSYQHGAELSRELGGRAAPFDRLFEEMAAADIVIASTSAPDHVVRREDAQRVARGRRGRPLFFIDIAVPRDVDPRVNEIDNVYVYDVDDLQRVVRVGMNGRREEAALAEMIVEREAAAYLAWLRALDVVPLIVDLKERMRRLGEAELARFRSRLGPLGPQQEKALVELTESLLNKLLHHPIRALKQAAADGGGDRLSILREALGLGASAGLGAGGERPGPADEPDGTAGGTPEGGDRSRT